MKPAAALLTIVALCFPPLCFAQNTDPVAAMVQKALRSDLYKNVQASVRGSVVTLTGTVDLYAARETAQDQVSRIRGIGIVHNEIQVATPAIPDRKLQTNVEEAMAGTIYLHLGYLPNIPHLLAIHVHYGIVSLGGYVPSPQLAEDIFEAVAHTKGVREIADRIQLGSNPVVDSPWPSAAPDVGTGVSH